MAKSSKKNQKSKKFRIIAIAGVLLIGIMVAIYFWLFKTTAQPSHFSFNDTLECEITQDRIIFDENLHKDCLQFDMNIKNIYDKEAHKQEIIEKLKEKGIEAEAPDPESESGTTYSEEIDQIQDSNAQYLANFTYIEVMQSNRNLTEKYKEANNAYNNEALATTVVPGETKNITLTYIIENTDDVFLYFSNLRNQENSFIVTFSTRGFSSWNLFFEKNAEIAEKQQTQIVELTGVKISIFGDWYVDKQTKVNVKLKNASNNGTLDIEYSSSQDAISAAKETASWFSPVPEIQEIDINGVTYQYIQPNENMFVLCTNSISANSIKITGNNIDMQEAMSIIKNLEFN